MKTEVITENKLAKYMTCLTNDEVFGMMNDRITCFGAFDESTGEAVGVLSAEILPDYIHIIRCFILPNHEDSGAGEMLLSKATNVSADVEFPFLFYDTEDKINEPLLEAAGFKKRFKKYSYITGRLSNLKDVPLPPIDKDIEVLPADMVSQRLISDYVYNSKKDTVLQIPEMIYDPNRFSDGSIVCVKNKRVVALILMEEKDDSITIPYMYGDDLTYIYYGFSVLRERLLEEYTPSEEIRFLICKENEKEVVEELMSHSKEKRIKIYEKR